jgi:hypothetical protein
MIEGMTLGSIGTVLLFAAVVATGAEAQAPAAPDLPASAAGQRYRLVEVAGAALPVEVEKDWSCRESVTRATLTLVADSTWVLRSTLREACGERAEVETEVEHGRYAREGTSLRFYDEDGEDDRDWDLRREVDLDDLQSGTVGADGSLTVRLDDGKTTLVFRQ